MKKRQRGRVRSGLTGEITQQQKKKKGFWRVLKVLRDWRADDRLSYHVSFLACLRKSAIRGLGWLVPCFVRFDSVSLLAPESLLARNTGSVPNSVPLSKVFDDITITIIFGGWEYRPPSPQVSFGTEYIVLVSTVSGNGVFLKPVDAKG